MDEQDREDFWLIVACGWLVHCLFVRTSILFILCVDVLVEDMLGDGNMDEQDRQDF